MYAPNVGVKGIWGISGSERPGAGQDNGRRQEKDREKTQSRQGENTEKADNRPGTGSV